VSCFFDSRCTKAVLTNALPDKDADMLLEVFLLSDIIAHGVNSRPTVKQVQ